MALNREQVIQAAEKYASRGKIEAAIKEYRRLIDESPGDTQALNRVGDLWVRLSRNDEAIKLFKQTAEAFSSDGFFVRAIAIYKKILKLDPTRLEAYERLAELYHKQGLTNEARTQYQVLVDYYLKHGNAASAIAILLKMAVLEPENPSHHVKLAEVYQEQKLLDKAMGEYRVIAELMLRKGHVDEATQVYMRALTVSAQDLGFIQDAVSGLREAGHTGQAARLLAAAVERNPAAEGLVDVVGLKRVAPENLTGSFVIQRPVAPPPVPAPTPEIAPPPAPPGPNVFRIEREPPPLAALPPVPLAEPAAPPAAPPVAAVPIAPPPISPPAQESEQEVEQDALELDLDLDFDAVGMGVDVPLAAAPAAAPVEPEVVETADALDFELEIEGFEELDAPPAGMPQVAPAHEMEPPLEIDWALSEPDLAPPPPAVRIDPLALERTAAEIQPAAQAVRDEDLIAEAEVLHKYGLHEKALERLRQALQMSPRHLGAFSQMISIQLDQGRHERVLALAQQMGEIAATARHAEPWRQTIQRLQRAGYLVEGERVLGVPGAKRPERPAPGPDRGTPPAGGPAAAPTAPIPDRRKTPRGVDAALAELTSMLGSTKAPRPAKPPASLAPPPSAAPAMASPPPPTVVPPPMVVPPPPARPPFEGLDDEDGFRLPEPLSAPQAAPPPPAKPEKLAAPPAPPAAPKPAAESFAGTPPAEEKLFDDEDEFFNLAAELERELGDVDLTHATPADQPQEQTLEEIVEGFKKGVAENLSAEDYDTHFNLGIAYREMGLLDEAIGEFQLSAKSPAYLVDCCSMLGLCFLDKGLPELAVKWYRRGLEAPSLAEEQMLGLLYDLGNAQEIGGERDAAYKTLVEIYGINSNYRDVVARLQELGPR